MRNWHSSPRNYLGSSTRLFTVKYAKMVVNRTNALFVLEKMKNCLHSWLSTRPCFIRTIANQNAYSPGGEGTPHTEGVGLLVVLLRGVNFGFWSHLGCSGQNAIIFSRESLV